MILKEEYDSILKEISRQKEDSVGNIIITDSNSDVKTKKLYREEYYVGIYHLFLYLRHRAPARDRNGAKAKPQLVS